VGIDLSDVVKVSMWHSLWCNSWFIVSPDSGCRLVSLPSSLPSLDIHSKEYTDSIFLQDIEAS